MTAAVSASAPTATLDSATPKSVRIVRAVALLAVGFAITFTATKHEQLSFDIWITAIGLAGIAVTHFLVAAATRGRAGAGVGASVALGVVSVAAAITLPVAVGRDDQTMVYALIVAAWALMSSLLEFLSVAVRPAAKQDAILVGALGMLLAVLTLLVREDAVAIVGFFGAYAIVIGVFLGISAFDTRSAAVHSPALHDANTPS